MRIFGFDIIRCSKADRMEEEEFNQITWKLYDVLNTISMIIDRRVTCDVETDTEFIRTIFQYVEDIRSLLKLHQKNKFATSHISVAMMYRLSKFRKHLSVMQKLILGQCYARERYTQVNQMYQEQDIANQEFDENFEELEKEYLTIRNRILDSLRSEVVILVSILQYDVYRIIYHVDIVRSTYYHQKRCPKGNPEYTVRIFEEPSDPNDNGMTHCFINRR